MPTTTTARRADEPDADGMSHIRGLGFETVEEYRRWCTNNGFSRKLKKNWKKRCQERARSTDATLRRRLEINRRERRNPVDILTAICEGSLFEDEVTHPHLKKLCQALAPDEGAAQERRVDRRTLLSLLLHVHGQRARFFDSAAVISAFGDAPGNTFLEALTLVAAHGNSWIRPIDRWKSRSHSAIRQFASLLRHLFVRYDEMPEFFDSAWFARTQDYAPQQREWYLHVGRGENIRHCHLPVEFTKRMAHHLMDAPSNLTVLQALRWGQVLGQGGTDRLARALFGTRLGESFEHEEFWSTVIRWFATNPAIDLAQVGPIVDYLRCQRFGTEGGRDVQTVAEQKPAQPNLTMKGRTPESLLARVVEWHQRLAQVNTTKGYDWSPSGIAGLDYVEDSLQTGGQVRWTIRELLGSSALVAEGRALEHCVATYAEHCVRGHSSIWSMEFESNGACTKALSVEVRNSSRIIVQVRGKRNRTMTLKERAILLRWAEEAGLTISALA